MHPHLLARSLSPGTWCCPPDPGVGWQTGFMQQVDGKGSDTQPRSPWWEGRLEGPCCGQSSPNGVCAVYGQECWEGLPQPGTKERGSTDGTAMPGAGSSPPGPSSSAWTAGGSGYSLARPMMVRMYRKMLMMSVYRFRAANTYSSGLRDSCLFPSSN